MPNPCTNHKLLRTTEARKPQSKSRTVNSTSCNYYVHKVVECDYKFKLWVENPISMLSLELKIQIRILKDENLSKTWISAWVIHPFLYSNRILDQIRGALFLNYGPKCSKFPSLSPSALARGGHKREHSRAYTVRLMNFNVDARWFCLVTHHQCSRSCPLFPSQIRCIGRALREGVLLGRDPCMWLSKQEGDFCWVINSNPYLLEFTFEFQDIFQTIDTEVWLTNLNL